MGKHLKIRDLQKLSSESIEALPGPTAIKAGDRTVAILTPLKRPDLEKLAAALKKAEQLAEGRDIEADLDALEAFGPIDRTNWTEQAVQEAIAPFKFKA
jgi:hypothetical protein